MAAQRSSEGGRFGKAPVVLEHTAPGHVRSSFELIGPSLPGQVSGGDMAMCTHCRVQWIIQPGSGKTRGYCFNCSDITCGRAPCMECVPWERALENHERIQNNINRLHYERTGVAPGNPNSPLPR